ncbi:PDZ domain-containing protein [Paenibacillus sp. GCM10027626]|uniref:YlbL family protein n=1 Tax=Paenibacillus sp. GCM10027626 TaxID=3273411 RepID=UPI00362ED435
MQKLKQWYRNNRWFLRWPLGAALIMTLLLYVPTPFAAYEPGFAIATEPLVRAAEPDEPSAGQFLLMTVKLSDANFWMALRSAWDRDLELYMKKDLLQGQTMKEYAERMTVIMQGSQSAALEAAYKQAGIAYKVVPEGLIVAVEGEGAGEQRPRTGDEVRRINGQEVKSVQQARAALTENKMDGELKLVVLRKGAEVEIHLPVINLTSGSDDQKELAAETANALYVKQLSELRRIAAEDPHHEVEIKANAIGGPSAGLMFALQVLDELTPGDLTNGLKIAGTGTISPDGEVGAIGGVTLKVVAAAEAGAQLFFVPEANAKEAAERAKQLGTGMEIVSVATLKEAVQNLEARQVKK